MGLQSYRLQVPLIETLIGLSHLFRSASPSSTARRTVRSQDRRVDACVLDSPFADFARVVADYCENTAALQWVPRPRGQDVWRYGGQV